MFALPQPLVLALAAAAGFGLLRGLPLPSAAAPPLPPVPPAHHILGVPLAQAQPDWCGPAALAAVLQYHGAPVTAEEIARDIYLPDYRGALTLDLLLWARRQGYEARAESGSPLALKRAIASNHPVICLLRKRGPLADRNHFVVVRGYQDDPPVWLLDAADGRELRVPAPAFERDWRDCRSWMLVIQEKPPSSGERDHASP